MAIACESTVVDLRVHDGLWCPFENGILGTPARLSPTNIRSSRETQDQYASTLIGRRTSRTRKVIQRRDRFGRDPEKKGDPIISITDETVRADTTVEALAKLSRPFKKDGGTVTPETHRCNDGCSALVVTSRNKLRSSVSNRSAASSRMRCPE